MIAKKLGAGTLFLVMFLYSWFFIYNTLPTNSYFVFIANKDLVYEPATILYWQDLHTFGYDELIKVKVKYDDTGSFNLYAYDHEQEIASGLSAWDDDNFDVTVS